MLSYQHAYHAGNMADVHKHGLLAWMLGYLTQKDKPLSYLETHAGRALYDLSGPESLKTGEAATGITIASDWFAPSHPYAKALKSIRALHGIAAYPGSPLLAATLLRSSDNMDLAELHPQEHAALSDAMITHPATCRNVDGWAMAQSLCPPMPRRGMLLIDPSFEVKTDYQTIPVFMRQIHRKWPVGILVLWYPMLADGRHKPMLTSLEEVLPEGIRHEVIFPPARTGHGMTGSGLFVVNPPYGFAQEAGRLRSHFAKLARQL